jgi:hypothetical protein
MNSKSLVALLFAACPILAAPAAAQSDISANNIREKMKIESDSTGMPASRNGTKMVTNTAMVSVGGTNILDTYLSQEKFHGWDARFLSHTFRDYPYRRISKEIVHQVILSKADTRGEGGTLLTAMYNLQYGWHWNGDFLARRLHLRLGGIIDGTIGGMYDTSNSNNPAQARLSLAVAPSAIATWHFGKSTHPFALQYEVSLPLLGLAFSPAYGQSYYEIFSRGNYDHNIVCTSPFNALQLHQMLTLDFTLFHSVFRIGYLGDFRQMEANDLKYHQYTHAIVIGWVRHFTLTPNRKAR